MKRTIWQVIFVTVMVFLFSAPAHATSSLFFGGGGYQVDLEIGHTDHPVIASVNFHAPGDPHGVLLRTGFEVTIFDTNERELLLHYKGDKRLPPFTLSVHGDEATLESGSERVSSTFNWEM